MLSGTSQNIRENGRINQAKHKLLKLYFHRILRSIYCMKIHKYKAKLVIFIKGCQDTWQAIGVRIIK